MLKLARTLILSLVCLAACNTIAVAHHSANADYDVEKSLSVEGVIEQIKDINPHAQWLVKVKSASGATESYVFDSQPLNGLRRQGLSVKSDLKTGTTLGFNYSPRRDGANGGVLRSITLKGKTYPLAIQ